MVIKIVLFLTPNIGYGCWKTQPASLRTLKNRLPPGLLVYSINATTGNASCVCGCYSYSLKTCSFVENSFVYNWNVRASWTQPQGPAWLGPSNAPSLAGGIGSSRAARTRLKNKIDAGFLLIDHFWWSLLLAARIITDIHLCCLSLMRVPSPAHTIFEFSTADWNIMTNSHNCNEYRELVLFLRSCNDPFN